MVGRLDKFFDFGHAKVDELVGFDGCSRSFSSILKVKATTSYIIENDKSKLQNIYIYI